MCQFVSTNSMFAFACETLSVLQWFIEFYTCDHCLLRLYMYGCVKQATSVFIAPGLPVCSESRVPCVYHKVVSHHLLYLSFSYIVVDKSYPGGCGKGRRKSILYSIKMSIYGKSRLLQESHKENKRCIEVDNWDVVEVFNSIEDIMHVSCFYK